MPERLIPSFRYPFLRRFVHFDPFSSCFFANLLFCGLFLADLTLLPDLDSQQKYPGYGLQPIGSYAYVSVSILVQVASGTLTIS